MRDGMANDEWTDPTWSRLNGCIAAYGEEAKNARRAYKRARLTQLALATAIPVIAGFQGEIETLLTPGLTLLPRLALAVLGIAFVILEFIQHLNEYQHHAFEFGARHTALDQEKSLFLAEAGPYAGIEDKRALLIERVGNLLLLDVDGAERRRSRGDWEYRMAA